MKNKKQNKKGIFQIFSQLKKKKKMKKQKQKTPIYTFINKVANNCSLIKILDYQMSSAQIEEQKVKILIIKIKLMILKIINKINNFNLLIILIILIKHYNNSFI